MDEKQAYEEMRARTNAVNSQIDEFNSVYGPQNSKEIEERIARLEANGININEPTVVEHITDAVQEKVEDVKEFVEDIPVQAELLREEAVEKFEDTKDALDAARDNLVREMEAKVAQEKEALEEHVVEPIIDKVEEVKENIEDTVENQFVSEEALRAKLTDKVSEVKTNLNEVKANIVGEDGKLDKEDVDRLSKEIVEKVQTSTEKVKETVLGEDGKFTEEDLQRLAHGLQEVGVSLAKLGEKGFSKLVKLLEEDK